MKQKTTGKSSDLRRRHNSDLLRRMREGENLNAYDSRASWFPPRPVIEKDAAEMARVYSSSPETAAPRQPALSHDQQVRNVVSFPVEVSGDGRSFDEAG